MQTACLEALLIPIADGVSLRLTDEAWPSSGQFSVTLPQGYRAVPSDRTMEAAQPADRPPFYNDATAPERGLNALRIFELRDYAWELDIEDAKKVSKIEITSSLIKSQDRDLWRGTGRHGRFQFVNFLGAAWIEVKVDNLQTVRIPFEVTSPKLDYEQEYRSMVEAIGNECQQLLLEWGTPTTLNISSDPEKRAQTLLERFLFLRQMLEPERLGLYLEMIQRRPHSRLDVERDWKPASAAHPKLFIRDPLRYGRGWHRTSSGPVPEEIREERKFDSLDTPPNRFLKFALQSFRTLCDEVLEAQRSGKPVWSEDSPIVLEARAMQQALDTFLALPLFDDVGELRRIPFESTTLQRREGYREILHAWLMIDAAAQIDWPGQNDAYKGTSRNVALLYEYWLYFLLARAFRDELKMLPLKDPLEKVDGALPFCCHAKDGRLTINLKQGKASFCKFIWKDGSGELCVHFFYNRSFGRAKVNERGTYSKTFRPDFTLVILPKEFENVGESAAEQAGKIAYLHFDAKYRGENLSGLFGNAEKETDEPEPISSSKNTDLYKMHTYNEAIRRTVGSYVLYPGLANAQFERYHEIIPGIGAFALRPAPEGLQPKGLQPLLSFIIDILTHQLSRFTQSYRISRSTEDIIHDTPFEHLREDNTREKIALPEADAVLGFMRKADIEVFASGKFFYCRATDEEGQPLDLDISAAQGAILIGWTGPRTGPFHTTNWMARIKSCRLVSREILQQETGAEPSSESAHYLLFKFEDVSAFDPRDISALVKEKNGSGEGGKFRTFQTTLKHVYLQKLNSYTASNRVNR